MSNASKNFHILAISLSVLIILIVQQNYFSDLYPAVFRFFSKTILFVYIYLLSIHTPKGNRWLHLMQQWNFRKFHCSINCSICQPYCSC